MVERLEFPDEPRSCVVWGNWSTLDLGRGSWLFTCSKQPLSVATIFGIFGKDASGCFFCGLPHPAGWLHNCVQWQGWVLWSQRSQWHRLMRQLSSFPCFGGDGYPSISRWCRAVSADRPLQHCVDFRGSTCGVVNRGGAPQWVCSSYRGFRLFSFPGKVYT